MVTGRKSRIAWIAMCNANMSSIASHHREIRSPVVGAMATNRATTPPAQITRQPTSPGLTPEQVKQIVCPQPAANLTTRKSTASRRKQSSKNGNSIKWPKSTMQSKRRRTTGLGSRSLESSWTISSLVCLVKSFINEISPRWRIRREDLWSTRMKAGRKSRKRY